MLHQVIIESSSSASLPFLCLALAKIYYKTESHQPPLNGSDPGANVNPVSAPVSEIVLLEPDSRDGDRGVKRKQVRK